MLNLGLIGFGRFGQFAATHLRSRVPLFVWDPRDLRKRAASLGLTWSTMEEAASCQIVLLAVPISEMPAALTEVVPYLRPGALLMDTCSVKMAPVQWMTAAAPAEVEVIGTHPLFGPQTARSGIEGLPLALCPARTRRAEAVESFLAQMGLDVIVTTPEDHDRQMAYAQALTHFVARGLSSAGMHDQALRTPTFDQLLRVVETVSRDSNELFNDMQSYNPFAPEARARLLDALHTLDKTCSED